MSEDRVEENQFRFQRFILFIEYCRILSFKEFSSYRFLNKFFSYNFISSDPTIRCLRQNCGLRVRIKSCIMQTKRIIDEPNHSKQLLSTCFNSMITGEGKKKKKKITSEHWIVKWTNYMSRSQRYRGIYVLHINQHASNLAVLVLYLLGKGYVIPVCIRVIQIFTGTERVSG